jgi:hypothetical protein
VGVMKNMENINKMSNSKVEFLLLGIILGVGLTAYGYIAYETLKPKNNSVSVFTSDREYGQIPLSYIDAPSHVFDTNPFFENQKPFY